MIVLAIDPGNEESAYCFIDSKTLQPLEFGKVSNRDMLSVVNLFSTSMSKIVYNICVIERMASYGMAVGKEVFETEFWAGRFTQAAMSKVGFVYRKDEKLHICGDSRAKDTNIRHALIERFASHDFARGKGTKKNPDFFYGFHRDIWQAFAVGLTYIETKTNQ